MAAETELDSCNGSELGFGVLTMLFVRSAGIMDTVFEKGLLKKVDGANTI